MARRLRFRIANVDYSGNFKVRIVNVVTLNAIQDPLDFKEIIKAVGNDFNIADNSIVKMGCVDSNNRAFYLNTHEGGRLLMKDIRSDDESLLDRVFRHLLNSNEDLLFPAGSIIKIQFWMVTEKGQWFIPREFVHQYDPETYNPMSEEEIQLFNRQGELVIY